MDSYPTTSKILTIIGGLIILKKVLQLLSSIYKTIFRRRHNFLKRYGEKSWVLITGSSEGTNIIITQELEGLLHRHLPVKDSTSSFQLAQNPNSKK